MDKVEEDRSTASGRARSRIVFDVNGQALALSLVDPDYRYMLAIADVVHADGEPVCIASRVFCENSIPQRTATTDLIHHVGRALSGRPFSVYFLGAGETAIDRAVARFRDLYPNVEVAGYRNGYFSQEDYPEVVSAINASGADVLFVGLGKPREQAFAAYARHDLDVSWIITAGGCFDFLAGNVPRAPEWMQSFALEWFFRLLQEPRRLALRYVWTNVVSIFALLVFTRRGTV